MVYVAVKELNPSPVSPSYVSSSLLMALNSESIPGAETGIKTKGQEASGSSSTFGIDQGKTFAPLDEEPLDNVISM